jgi:hypothetical protein
VQSYNAWHHKLLPAIATVTGLRMIFICRTNGHNPFIKHGKVDVQRDSLSSRVHFGVVVEVV